MFHFNYNLRSCIKPQITNYTIKMTSDTKLKDCHLRWLVACLRRKQKKLTIDQGNCPVRMDIEDDEDSNLEHDSLGLQQTKEALSDEIVALLNNSGSSEESVEMLLSNDLVTTMRLEGDKQQQLRKEYSSVNVRTCKSKVCRMCWGREARRGKVSFIKTHSKNRAMF